MPNVDRNSFVLVGLASFEGRTIDPVRAQKFFFLVDRKLGRRVGGPYFAFEPYAYGPFDREVYDEIDRLSRRGLVELIGVPGSRNRRFRLTEEGQRAGEELWKSFEAKATEYMRDLARTISTMSFADLVSAIYDAYPDMKKNSIFFR